MSQEKETEEKLFKLTQLDQNNGKSKININAFCFH